MQRICFTLTVKPELIEEYRARHADVWPEMRQALQATGWRNYSLFLRDDGLLIGYLETDDFQAALDGMARLEVNTRWQAEMLPFFADTDGTAADQAIQPITEVFHLD